MMNRVMLLAVLFLVGCASAGVKVDPSKVGQFKRGVATEADVIAALGEPNSRSTLADGTAQIGYVNVNYTTKAATFIPIVGMFAGGADTDTTAVNFVFGSDGKLKSTTTDTSKISAGMFGSQSR